MSPVDRVSPDGRAEANLHWWHATRAGLVRLREVIRQTREPPDALQEALDGKTDAEVEEWFHAQLVETDILGRFLLLTTAEAVLMSDFQDRCRSRAKDALSEAARKLEKRARTKNRVVALDPDILECWTTARPASKSAVGVLRGHFKYRHWVAHGRYWSPKLGRAPGSPEDLATAIAGVMEKLALTWR